MLSTLSKRLTYSKSIFQQLSAVGILTRSSVFPTTSTSWCSQRRDRSFQFISCYLPLSTAFRCQSIKTGNDTHSIQTTNAFSLRISPNKEFLVLKDGDSEPVNFHAVWLRHHCHCPECKQPHSGQKMIDVSQLQASYTMASAHLDSKDQVCIEWNEEKHSSIFPLEFLVENQYSANSLHQFQSSMEVHPSGELPKMKYEELLHEEGQLSWMRYINQHGLCLILNVPTCEWKVKDVAELIWPVQETIYGRMWDVKSEPHPINIAYSDVKLDFHMDLAYYESPPGIQFLHCMKFDDCVEGGRSQFVDVWHVAESLRRKHPEDFDILTQVPATFQKVHSDRDHPVHMRYQRPHIMLQPNGQIVGIFWAPAFEGPLRIADHLVKPYYTAYHRFAKMIHDSLTRIEFRLVPGDVISFNNRRILHAREEFHLNGGMRHLQGCYVNIDEFKSRLEVLSRKLRRNLQVRHVLNQSWN